MDGLEKALPRPVPLIAQHHPLRRRLAILILVVVLPHHGVQAGAAEVEDLLEGFAEIPVQSGVDNRVQQGVGIAQPEE